MAMIPQGTGIFYVEATADSPTSITPVTPFYEVECAIKSGAYPILRYWFGGDLCYKYMTTYTPGSNVNFNGTRVSK